jgi:hypothetical protein
MTERIEIPNVEQFDFFPGQQLTAADLNGMMETHRQLRWLHNRSLHAWGIGLGFLVRGEPGDREVTVEPGYGIDKNGREILLGQPVTMTVPAVAGGAGSDNTRYSLVASYVPDAELPRRPITCRPGGAVRWAVSAKIAWRQAEEVQEGLELILAEVQVRNCRLCGPVSFAARLAAQPAKRPYISAGRVTSLVWSNMGTGCMSTWIDTSASRFRATPVYTAHIEGERLLAAVQGGDQEMIVVAFSSITETTRAGFKLQVLFPAIAGPTTNPINLRANPADYFERNPSRWSVVWMGIEG